MFIYSISAWISTKTVKLSNSLTVRGTYLTKIWKKNIKKRIILVQMRYSWYHFEEENQNSTKLTILKNSTTKIFYLHLLLKILDSTIKKNWENEFNNLDSSNSNNENDYEYLKEVFYHAIFRFLLFLKENSPFEM